MTNNKINISGLIETKFMIDHEFYNERFYQFLLSVKRTSGIDDIIPVIVSERLVNINQDLTGSYVEIVGEFRSFNCHENDKSKLVLYIFPQYIRIIDKIQNTNEISLYGTIVKDPVLRTTPQGRTITDIIIAVNREYNKSDYIPCIAWGRNAYYVANKSIGDKIEIVGRIQSRNYNKGDTIKTAYEVSINLLN